ncbi:MAG: DNA polymerase III subunit beta, partial [Gammaproteobacteria bacterium]|nr:DNA polymerase III subunit beta [Gammaproteobacteria bacterium]
MRFKVSRETFLKPIQTVIGVVERRQTMPILSNVLISVDGTNLSIAGTDLEVELQAGAVLEETEAGGDITVPGRKLLDICKALPDGAILDISMDKDRMVLRSGRSRFTLSTLPAAEFPLVEDISPVVSFQVPQKTLKKLLDQTHFSMAHQDVRYYLNGLLMELSANKLRTVATDGHRLALCDE